MFTYFRNLREEKKRKEVAEEIARKRKEWYENLDKIPREEMFRVLREKGGIQSLKELQETKNLSRQIKEIWQMTIDDMTELSLNLKKVRRLYDTRHVYFIPHDLYESWDKETQYFLGVLANLDELNSFYVVNSLGRIYVLNPLDEPVSTANDSRIKSDIQGICSGYCH